MILLMEAYSLLFPARAQDAAKSNLTAAPWPHAAYLDLLWWDAPHMGGSPAWLSRMLRGILDGLQPVLDLIDRPAFEASFLVASRQPRPLPSNPTAKALSKPIPSSVRVHNPVQGVGLMLYLVRPERLLKVLESELVAAHEKEVAALNAEQAGQTFTVPASFNQVMLALPPKLCEPSDSNGTSQNHTPLKRYQPPKLSGSAFHSEGWNLSLASIVVVAGKAMLMTFKAPSF
ncbi:unnamed protein product [Symbiodinium natans]|uniref:Uncharacterized protein n=1 Tax=Symbiodinium natans TaxID=878477 RepID=A0A812L1T4_9DINO|nr:unnamed protein product [Symbiodinium natans]